MQKAKTQKPRVYLGKRELGAMAFLKNFPDFQALSEGQVLKTCLMIVAIDAKLKLEEAKKNEKQDSRSDSNADGEPSTNELRREDSSGEDNRGTEESAGKAK